jgi:hypothetical protein
MACVEGVQQAEDDEHTEVRIVFDTQAQGIDLTIEYSLTWTDLSQQKYPARIVRQFPRCMIRCTSTNHDSSGGTTHRSFGYLRLPLHTNVERRAGTSSTNVPE